VLLQQGVQPIQADSNEIKEILRVRRV